jgi:hypothetical protein
MKKIIVRLEHLNEFVEKKKAERIFYKIVEDLHKNVKYLNEGVSHKKANQSIIENYKRKNLITPRVYEMLVKHKIINENHEII